MLKLFLISLFWSKMFAVVYKRQELKQIGPPIQTSTDGSEATRLGVWMVFTTACIRGVSSISIYGNETSRGRGNPADFAETWMAL
jgi:hypothetical protein